MIRTFPAAHARPRWHAQWMDETRRTTRRSCTARVQAQTTAMLDVTQDSSTVHGKNICYWSTEARPAIAHAMGPDSELARTIVHILRCKTENSRPSKRPQLDVIACVR